VLPHPSQVVQPHNPNHQKAPKIEYRGNLMIVHWDPFCVHARCSGLQPAILQGRRVISRVRHNGRHEEVTVLR
jgi:hypothetical protein